MVETLSNIIKEAIGNNGMKGIKVSMSKNITQLLFVDDILIFCDGSKMES